MPAKNLIKLYEEGGYYHIYNRGVEKRTIFEDSDDYKKFIGFLKTYLSAPKSRDLTLRDTQRTGAPLIVPPSRVLKNYNDQIDLIAYCLMPNHFHLLIKQRTERGMAKFMQSLMTKYSMYFNKRYHRVGSLFQGAYKTVKIESEQQLKYVSKYIHRNPLPDQPTRSHLEVLGDYQYSSYGNYIGHYSQVWLKPDDVLHSFSQTAGYLSYKSFVEETGDLKLVYYDMIDLDY